MNYLDHTITVTHDEVNNVYDYEITVETFFNTKHVVKTGWDFLTSDAAITNAKRWIDNIDSNDNQYTQ